MSTVSKKRKSQASKVSPSEESNESTQKRIKKTKIIQPVTARLSSHYCAPQLTLLDGLTVRGEKGYSSVLCTHGVSKGEWFYEIKVNQALFSSHVRVGWMTDKGDLQAPVGFDRFGYSFRDSPATVFHRAKGRNYGTTFGPGDVIGCYIKLVDLVNPMPLQYSNAKDGRIAYIPRSKISYYKNGVDLGEAFHFLMLGSSLLFQYL